MAKIGNQIPRICIEPIRSGTDGAGAGMLMEKYAYKLDVFQSNILDCWLGYDEDGIYNTTSAGLSLGRQNGKSEILLARSLYGLIVNGERILYTCHLMKPAKKAFRRLATIFEDKQYPEINSLVDHIKYANGEESIYLKNGGSVEFCSRSKQSARGYDAISLVIFDEAQELQDEELEAIMATLSASNTGTRQILYVGTPIYPTCNGTVFARFRESIINSEPDSEERLYSAWHEWSVDAKSIDDIDIENKELWYQCNPAMNIRLTERFTMQESKSMDKAGFCRERLGFWAPTLKVSAPLAINAEDWYECAIDSTGIKMDGKVAYGVRFSADNSEVCLCGCLIPDNKEEKAFIEVIKHESTSAGLKWLAEWLNERYHKASCVVIDGKASADILIDRLSEVWKIKNSVIRTGAKDVIQATSLIQGAISEHEITWNNKQKPLEVSATTSVLRSIGSGFGFGGGYSLPIEACALAFYGCRISKRNPRKAMRIG